jgi:hypothetical protein
MRSRDLKRLALNVCVAVVMLAGCGGSQPPIGAPGEKPRTSAIATHADRGKSWMRPEANGESLLYISDDGLSQVYVLSYPKGALVGTLTGAFNSPLGECVDAVGDVWVTNYGAQEIIEYAHGGTEPIATLTESAEEYPEACSIDPTTGNLAVANTNNVAIYEEARGTPTLYFDPDIYTMWSCAYDGSGDLFADGEISGEVGEIPKGGSSFMTVTLNEDFLPLSMQWDGTYLAIVEDSQHGAVGPRRVARVSISGSSGTVASTTVLKSPGGKSVYRLEQYWITGNSIVGPDRYREGGNRRLAVLTWRYPHGGQPIATIRKQQWSDPWGTAVSPAAKL